MAKKITAIVSLSIIGVLIVATIIMANIKCSYGVNFATPDEVTVSYANSSLNQDPTGEQANKIVSLINDASKENTLTAMFSGTLFDTAEVETTTPNGTSSIKKENGKFYVYLTYANPQKLMVGKKEYKDADNKTYYYKELVFEVSNTTGVEETKVYIIPSYKPNTNEPYNEGGYSKFYKLKANFSSLYSYLEQAKFN